MTSYDLMKQQIERETSEYLKSINNKEDITKPELEYKKGAISIKFEVKDFPKVGVLDAIDTLKDYYSEFSDFNPHIFSGYGVTAKLKRDSWSFNKLSEGEKKQNEIVVSFELNKFMDFEKTTNIICFKKEAELAQEEINCILDVWKKYADRASKDDKKEEDVEQTLFDLGAKVYRTNEDFTWDCIAGYDKIKKEIKETIILPFKHPDVYKKISELTRKRFSSNVPEAVLFEGPPGTGKTTIARIISNESGLPLVYVPIESIMSCWYGVAEQRLSNIFDYCNKLGRSMLFLDEIDSLATSRDNNLHEATRRILSVLLRKMQGFVSAKNVLTIGATNRVKDLDHALVSRFDRILTFPLPNMDERNKIFNYYAKHLDNAGLEKLVETTEGRNLSGRDIEDICGDVERRWASKIINDKAEVSPPSLETYLESITKELK